jgi:hypothetical protein
MKKASKTFWLTAGLNSIQTIAFCITFAYGMIEKLIGQRHDIFTVLYIEGGLYLTICVRTYSPF